MVAGRDAWRDAVLMIVAHGSSRCNAIAGMMARHAAALEDRRLFAEIRMALLHGGPAPSEGLAGLPGRSVYVMPMMMCAGRHVTQTLPQALGAAGEALGQAAPVVHFFPPLGLHPAIAGLIAARVRGRLARHRCSPGQASVLLVAHGSRTDPASHRAAELQAGRLRARGLFGSVSTAFLEEQPSLPAALAVLPGPLVVAGLFAAPGMHADHDVTAMLADCRRNDLAYLGAIGADAAIPEIIVKIVQAATAALPPAPAEVNPSPDIAGLIKPASPRH